MSVRPLPGSLRIPDEVLSRYSAWQLSVAYQYAAPGLTYRMDGPDGSTRFLKLAPADAYPALRDEADRIGWLKSHMPVPPVLEVGQAANLQWMITSGIAGADATHAEWKAQPDRLVAFLARTLRDLHSVPVQECPFSFTLDVALDHVRRRVHAGLVVPDRDFHEEFSGHSVDSALELLEASKPSSEDLVVCHGDFCLPNVILEEWSLRGLIDLGELGVADRWWDIAVATWSIEWNLGPGLEDRFLQEYGVEVDRERLDFYRLLYDMVG